ncbi:MAG: hypothetical protein WAN14_11145 [Candidatus Acidiferrales bacterium]
MKTPVGKTCEYAGGCDREATRLFPASPVKGWLCDEHFHQTLNALAEVEAADRRKLDAEWVTHFEKYRRETNLNPAELTETQTRQIRDEVHRWLQDKRADKGQDKRKE